MLLKPLIVQRIWGNKMKKLLFLALMTASMLSLSCTPDHSLQVSMQFATTSLQDIYLQSGNEYYFTLYDATITSGDSLIYEQKFSGNSTESFRTDDVPTGCDLIPQIHVYNSQGTRILLGTLTSTDDPAHAPGSPSFCVYENEAIKLVITLSQV